MSPLARAENQVTSCYLGVLFIKSPSVHRRQSQYLQMFPADGEHECLVESNGVSERLLVISDQIAETTANKIRRVYEDFDPNQEDVWIDVRDV